MRTLDVVVAVLLVVGGLNWGLVGIANFDLVAAIGGGSASLLSKAIYLLVGASAIYQIFSLRAIQKRWNVRPRIASA